MNENLSKDQLIKELEQLLTASLGNDYKGFYKKLHNVDEIVKVTHNDDEGMDDSIQVVYEVYYDKYLTEIYITNLEGFDIESRKVYRGDVSLQSRDEETVKKNVDIFVGEDGFISLMTKLGGLYKSMTSEDMISASLYGKDSNDNDTLMVFMNFFEQQ